MTQRCDVVVSKLQCVSFLMVQLDMLHDLVHGKTVNSVYDIIGSLHDLGPVRNLFGKLSKLLVLLLLTLAASATAERSFSCLRRTKTYLQLTVGEERLNYLLILHTHQDLTDSLDLETVACDFLSLNDYCRDLFGVSNN